MDQMEERIKDLSEIRTMMERSSKFLSLSGLSGVSAGFIALAGVCWAYWRLSSPGISEQPIAMFYITDAGIVLVAAIVSAMIFSVRMAKKKNLPLWGNTTKLLLSSLSIPLATGGIFCFILLYHGVVSLIPSATLIFYGLALLNSSKFTVNEIRYLAIAEILLGLTATLLLDDWLIIWATGFGVLHIAYGVILYIKYEK